MAVYRRNNDPIGSIQTACYQNLTTTTIERPSWVDEAIEVTGNTTDGQKTEDDASEN